MSPFPWISLFFMFFSPWFALDKRFRSDNIQWNWILFYLNLFAGAINTVFVLAWIFEWMTS